MSRPLRVSLFVSCLLAAAALGAGGMYLSSGRPVTAEVPGHPSPSHDGEHQEAGAHDHAPGTVALTAEQARAPGSRWPRLARRASP